MTSVLQIVPDVEDRLGTEDAIEELLTTIKNVLQIS